MMRELFERWRWALLIAVTLAAGLVYAFWPTKVAIDTGKVSRGPMSVGITDDGVTRARELYVVSAPVTGYLSRIELHVGDPVLRGALITQMTARPSTPLDPRSQQDLRAALVAARANERRISAELVQARREPGRAEALSRRGFMPRSQLEAARTKVSTGQAALAQARAEVARITAQSAAPTGRPSGASIAVRAPASGSVLSVINESAGVIPEGTPLMSIGDPRRIEVVVDLLSREAVRVKVGDRVEITQWGGDTPLSGHVARIEPFGRQKISALGIEEQRVNLIVVIDPASLPQAVRLGHGFQVDATVVLWNKPDSLRVPIGALFRGPEGDWRVFVVERGRTIERSVKIGHLYDEFGEVIDGLTDNQIVVLNPGGSIASGTKVQSR